MIGRRPCDSNGDVRLVRIQLAARDAIWTLAILARLREGEATSAEIADAAGVPARGMFNVVRDRLRANGLIVSVGQRMGRLGFVEHVWAQPVVEMRRAA